MDPWETGTTEVAPGVFAYVQATGGFCIANAGVITGGDSARASTTVIDALFSPSMTGALLDETKRLSASSEIARLLNTHHHVDHTLGNALFPAETEIVAHARAKAEMERVGLGVLGIIQRMAPHFEGQLDDVQERLPDVTFDGDVLELDAGGRRMRLLHFGTGHTRGDVLAHLPEEKVLFLGDIGFFFVTPMAMDGHVGNWIRVCDRIIDEVDADVLVPGHGPVGTKLELRLFRDYLRLVHEGSRRGFDAGASVQEATAAIDLGPYAEWGEPERLSINVNRCYEEFRDEIEL